MRSAKVGTVLIAICCLRVSVAQGTGPTNQVFQQAGQEYLRGNFPAAEKLFRQATQLEPAMIDAHEYLGHTLFKEERYREAIPVFLNTLKLDSKHVLPLAHRRAVIDELGMAYGISGDLQTSKTHFERAIRDDPDYPMFYYNLACAYGEMGELEPVLLNLRAAFERKQNLNQYETMPDPATDDSFRRFAQDARFKQLLREAHR